MPMIGWGWALVMMAGCLVWVYFGSPFLPLL